MADHDPVDELVDDDQDDDEWQEWELPKPGETKAEYYRRLAAEGIVALLEGEHAVVWHEIEAKLAEHAQPGARYGINPHHLTTAKQRLLADRVIDTTTQSTRGGRMVTVFGLAGRADSRQRIAFQRAAGRKRLLEARYLGWAEGKGRGAHVIGDAGEVAARGSLRAAAAAGAGYRLFKPEGGEIEDLWGRPVPGGSLDDAAELIVGQERARTIVTVLIEVKNLRSWLYPRDTEIHQLLYKAAMLQLAEPDELIMPVLICRRVHHLVFRMAKHLGFFVADFDNRAQPVLIHNTVGEAELLEVQSELGYSFARIPLPEGRSFHAQPHLTDYFRTTIPRQARATAERWQRMTTALAPTLDRLRSDRLEGRERGALTDDLHRRSVAIVRPTKPWRKVL